jgi:hypothetical protein
MIPYRSDRESADALVAGGSGLKWRGSDLTRRRVVDYCRVTAAL